MSPDVAFFRRLMYNARKITVKTIVPALILATGLLSSAAYGQSPKEPSIKSPVKNARVTAAQITVSGTTAPGSGATTVHFTIDGNGPLAATQGDHGDTNNWEATVPLEPGPNEFVVWADNALGSSPSNSANYFRVVTSAIKISTHGDGSVLPIFTGTKLDIGGTYTIFAVPGKGQYFKGWTGGITSSDQLLTFVMTPGLQVTADFTASPFASNGLFGAYGGLFWDMANPSKTNAGLLTLILNSNGVFSGQVTIDGIAKNFTSQFFLDSTAQLTIHRHNQGDLNMSMALDLTGVNGLTGMVSSAGTNGTGAFSATLQAYHRFVNTDHRGDSIDGSYTFGIEGAGYANRATAPDGYSYGTASANTAGLVNANLFLSDGTSAIASGYLTQSNGLPLYVTLYGGAGAFLGWVTFTNGALTTDDPMFWFKQPVAKGDYTNGFSLTNISMWVAPFHPPARDANVLGLSNAVVSIAAGDLSGTLSDPILLNAKGTSSGTNANDAGVSLNNQTGLFSGSFVDPIDGQTTVFHGAALEADQQGLGYFISTNHTTGAVIITSAPIP